MVVAPAERQSFTSGPVCCPERAVRGEGIRGYGNPSHGIVFVGIAPGRDEVAAGRPFVGASGKLLDACLDSVGLSRDLIYCTNVCCWWNNEPTAADIAQCAPRLKQELAHLNPKVIVTIGAVPTTLFCGGRSIGQARGIPQWNSEYDCWVLPMYHPAAVLRGQPDLIYDIVRDLAKIEPTTYWPKDVGHVQWKVASKVDIERLNHLLRIMPAETPVALDIETGTVDEDDPHGAQEIVCASIAYDPTYAFVIRGSDLARLDFHLMPSVRWTFHGGMFDVQGLRRHLSTHPRVPIVEDTSLQSYSLDERTTGIHGLDSLAGEYCGGEFYKEATQAALRRGAAGRIDPELLYERNAKDAAYTHRLQRKFEPEQVADGVRNMYTSILIPAANMFADVQYRGVYADLTVATNLQRDWSSRYRDMELQLQQLALDWGWEPKVVRHRYKPESGQKGYYTVEEPFNPRSFKQVGKLLYQHIGLRGGPSTDEAHLKALGGQHPVVDHMLSIRGLGQMLLHYLEPLPRYVRDDGRLHARVLLHGTPQGRLSYRDPPLQTIPHYVEDSLAGIRKIFAASDDEHLIMEADYSQAEVWMAAAYAGDERMFRDLRGSDYHGSVAQRVFGVDPADPFWKLRRQAAKVITFGNMYGTEAPSLAGRIGASVAEARAYLDAFFGEYSALSLDIEETQRQARERGYVEMISGRRRRFPAVFDKKAPRTAYNAKISGTASDYSLTSAIELHPLLVEFDSYIDFLVHDSIVMEVSKRWLMEVVDLTKRVMEKPRFEGFPSIPVDIKVGPNWFEMEDVEKWLSSSPTPSESTTGS